MDRKKKTDFFSLTTLVFCLIYAPPPRRKGFLLPTAIPDQNLNIGKQCITGVYIIYLSLWDVHTGLLGMKNRNVISLQYGFLPSTQKIFRRPMLETDLLFPNFVANTPTNFFPKKFCFISFHITFGTPSTK